MLRTSTTTLVLPKVCVLLTFSREAPFRVTASKTSMFGAVQCMCLTRTFSKVKISLSGGLAHSKECFSVSAPCTPVKHLWCLTTLLAASPCSFTWCLTISFLPSLRSKGRMIHLTNCLEHATYIHYKDIGPLDYNLPDNRASLWHQILQDKAYSLLPYQTIHLKTLPTFLPIKSHILPCLLMLILILSQQAYPPLLLHLLLLCPHQP
jgi:hypothetical protein